MKNILIAAGIVGAAAAGVVLYMRNRNQTSKTLHDVADAAGDAHEGVRKFFRKSKNEAKREYNHAMS